MSILRLCALGLVAAGCARGGTTATTATPVAQPLAAFAVHRIILTPGGYLRADTSAWMRQGPVSARMLDTALAGALTTRGLAQNWILPPALAAAYERNRTYAADPYRLALQPLLSPRFVAQERIGEPLSTQLRTMIALHDDARLVLIPIELHFEPAGRAARGVLKLALVDPRFAHAIWVGTVSGEAAVAPGTAVASVATRVADLFLAP